MKRKILSFVLIILAIASAICAFSVTASAEDNGTPTVTIGKFNLVFEDNVYLKYAVRFDGVDDEKINSLNIGMLYFTEPQSDYTNGGEAYSSSVVGYTTIDGSKYYTFEYRHITAKQMTDYIYSVAYIDIDGEKYYSAPVKYSVLDYCYSKLGKTGTASTNERFKNLLTVTLEQGAMAQEYFEYKTDRLANAEYYLVEVVGGTLEDGFTKGLYHGGETVTLTAPEKNGTLVFNKWENDLGDIVYKTNSVELVNLANNSYFCAKYKQAIEYSDGLEFLLSSDGTYYTVIGRGTCNDTKIAIPSIYENLPVRRIQSKAFENCSDVKSIIIPDSITYIQEAALFGCSSLESLTVPFVGTSSGNSYGKAYLLGYLFGTEIFEGSVATVQEYTSYSSYNSTITYYIPATLTQITVSGSHISQRAFNNCKSLTAIHIPDVISIGQDAFDGCSSLREVYIDNIGRWCNIKFEEGANYYTNPLRYANCLHVDNKSATEIIVPSGVKNIYSYAFSATNITAVTLSDTVETINENAFYKCGSLTDLVFPSSIKNVAEDAFYGCENLAYNEYDNAYYLGCPSNPYVILMKAKGTEITSCAIFEETKFVYRSAFFACSQLKEITIPDSVIGSLYGTFAKCTALTDVVVGSGISSLDYMAFSGCTNLTNITVKEGVKTISNWAFENCSNLKTLILPDSATDIREYAFDGCTSMETLTLPDLSSRTLKSMFCGNPSSLKNVVITGGKSIVSGALTGCSSLESLTLPFVGEKLKTDYSSGAYPFGYAFGKSNYSGSYAVSQKYLVGSTYSSYESETYYIPKSLTSVTVTDGNIGYGAFQNCGYITDITLPQALTSIGDDAFNGCGSLSAMVIPETVTSIGINAFSSCYALSSVSFQNTTGWWYSSSSTATSGKSISSSYLSDTAKAATYLRSTYSHDYWKRT